MSSSRLSVFCDRALEIGWLLGVTITPVFFNVYSSRVFEPDKLTTLRALAVVMAILWIARYADEKLRDRAAAAVRFSWNTPLVMPALLTMLVYLISTAFSVVPYTSFMGSYQRLQGTYSLFGYLVIFFAILTSLRTRAQLSRLVTVLILNSLPVSLYGIVQHSGSDPLPWAGDVMRRVASNMGNAIFVAAYLIMIVPLTGARIVESFGDILTREDARFSDILRASGYIFILAVQLLTIWFSQSRGPWLGVVVIGFLFPYLGLISLLRQVSEEDGARGSWVDIGRGLVFGLGAMAGPGAAAGLLYLLLGWLGGVPALAFLRDSSIPLYAAGLIAALLFGGLWLYFVVERKGWRWLWIGWGTMGMVGALLLLAVNVEGPLQARAREVDALRRLTTITQLQDGTGKVRGLIWQGTVDLILPGDPITYPDGTEDPFNAVRPLIGYGPESMYVAYNSVYPPELGHYEARTASPDRAHNETLDALAITGVLGLAVYILTFGSAFYWGFRWLGLLENRRQFALFVALDVVIALVFFIIATNLEGAYLFAVAIPLGMLVGKMLYLTLRAVGYLFWGRYRDVDEATPETSARPPLAQPHLVLIIAIITAIMAHFVEINFGIAIAATRTTFWAMAGLLVVLGKQWVAGVEEVADPTVTVARQSRRRKSRQQSMPRWVIPVVVLSLVGTFLLGTLAFDFINNPTRSQFAYEIFTKSLTTRLVGGEEVQSYGALMIFFFTWLVFGLVGLSEYDREGLFKQDAQAWGIALFVYALISLMGLLMFGSMVAEHQAMLTKIPVDQASIETLSRDVVNIAITLAGLLGRYYFLIFFTMIVAGTLAMWEGALPDEWGSGWAALILTVLLLGSIYVNQRTNYDLIRADIVFKQGGVFANSRSINEKQIGIAHYKQSLDYVPREDYYNLFLGKTYLELTQGYPVQFDALDEAQRDAQQAQWQASVDWASLDATQQQQLMQQWIASWEQQQRQQQRAYFDETERVLLHARELNPLNTDHSANLARFYKSWAARVAMDMRAPDLTEAELADLAAQREALLEKSQENYETALMLSPNNPIIWNELAQLYASDMNDMVMFHEIITQSLQVDPDFEQTWMLLGDMRSTQGDADGAIEAYQMALEAPRRSFPQHCTVRQVLGTLQVQHGKWDDALDTLTLAVERCARDRSAWELYRLLAIVYSNIDDIDAARDAANQALMLAPEAQQATMQQLVDSLEPQVIPVEPEPEP